MVTSAPDLPSRLSPSDLGARELTSRSRAGLPATSTHGEHITLSDDARQLGRGQGPHARGDVRWYRAPHRPPGHGDRAPAARDERQAAPLAAPAFALPGGRHARAAIAAYRAGMSPPA